MERRKYSWPFIWKIFEKKFHEIPKIKTWICHSSSTTYIALTLYLDFSGGSDSKESACSAGDTGLIPGWGRSPGEENSNPLQNSCLENSMDGGAWQAPIHGAAKSWTEWLTLLVIWAKAQCQIVLHPDWVKAISPQCRWLPRAKVNPLCTEKTLYIALYYLCKV